MAKKVAIYCRVSTKEQTTDNQTLDLKRFCEHRDLEIVQEYSDQGVSGSKDSRPVWPKKSSALNCEKNVVFLNRNAR